MANQFQFTHPFRQTYQTVRAGVPDRHAHTQHTHTHQLSSHLFDIRHVEYSDLTLMEMFASRGGIHHRAGPSALHSAARDSRRGDTDWRSGHMGIKSCVRALSGRCVFVRVY